MKKILVLGIVLLGIFLIYLSTLDKKVYFLSLGDEISQGINLYNKNGNLFSANYVDINNVSQSSSLFRVQTVNDDTVNLLILREDNGTYYSTNTFITVKIGCICAIKCVIDTTVEFG